MFSRLRRYLRALLNLSDDTPQEETPEQAARCRECEKAVRAITEDAVRRVHAYRPRMERLHVIRSRPVLASEALFVAACLSWGALLVLLASLMR